MDNIDVQGGVAAGAHLFHFRSSCTMMEQDCLHHGGPYIHDAAGLQYINGASTCILKARSAGDMGGD